MPKKHFNDFELDLMLDDDYKLLVHDDLNY